MKDRINNASKGFAFCEFQSESDAKKCWEELNGKFIGTRMLSVKKATAMSAQELQLTNSFSQPMMSIGTIAKNFLDSIHNNNNNNTNSIPIMPPKPFTLAPLFNPFKTDTIPPSVAINTNQVKFIDILCLNSE